MSHLDQQKPPGRHGKKSRGGCFNCKTRKVKCSEVRPTCESCYIRGLPCVYPSKREQMLIRRKAMEPLMPGSRHLGLPAASLSQMPSTFSAADFRYFHYFLTDAYPHLPHDSESAWSFEVPKLSHNYKPLLHAILSLSASHRAVITESPQEKADSIFHRGLALAGLSKMLAQKSRTSEELDVLLAMCYALTLQSSHMTGGLGDFLFMIRGCALVTKQIAAEPQPTTIFCLDPSSHIRRMLRRLPENSILEPFSLNKGISCLESLRPFIIHESHRRFADAVLETLVALQYSTAQEAYLTFLEIFRPIYTMDEQSFQQFIAPENSLGQVILSYLSAVLVVMQPYLKHEIPDRLSIYVLFSATTRWMDSSRSHVSAEWSAFVQWPFEVIRAFQRNATAFGSDIEGLIRQILVLADTEPVSKQNQPMQPV